jgi:hypothetical protein
MRANTFVRELDNEDDLFHSDFPSVRNRMFLGHT